ncbi:MAG TPA: FtsX-like permease family protein [Candidatus Acidoferrales bacterium]|nr:FtsX-like permease family protein [Candidatus Acidoferrales bacterium]
MKLSGNAWIWKMAWRDARSARKKLLLAVLPVALGVGSLVAISSYVKSIEGSLQQQSKVLLGADLAIESRQPFSAEALELIAAIPGEGARQTSFLSMIYFPKNGAAQLAQVRALEGNFPFYGTLETDPPEAARAFHGGAYALVDESLSLQHDAGVGDTVTIGRSSFRIAGRLKKIPGESLAATLIGPRVYIPMRYLEQTHLLKKGSLVRYRAYFRLNPDVDPDRLVQKLTPELRRLRLETDTVSRRKAMIGRAFENLSRFLNLVGFGTVLLAGLGVASAIYVYARDKIGATAILRCVGARANHAFSVYALQAAAVGTLGAAVGVLLGIALQGLLPRAFRDFIPAGVTVPFSLSGAGVGFGTGLAFALLFCFLPLCSLRRVSPLLSLRASFERLPGQRDPLLRSLYAALTLAAVLFARAQMDRWLHALIFTAALAGALALLLAVARALALLLKRLVAPSWSYPWRQGLANLYRPKNQTTVLVLSIGVVTALVVTAYLSRTMLLQEIAQRSAENEPNVVLFDVQTDQAAGLAELIRSFGLRLYQDVPVVSMRLAAVKGVEVAKLRADPKSKIPPWALRREYRSTYRDRLIDSETLVAGSWQGSATGSTDVPVSVEKEIADALGVTIGDELTFDVDGVLVSARVASLREVDWQRVQPNFFVVFPRGVLEEAPQFRVFVTRVDSNEASARLQRAVVRAYPNVSVIDIRLILATVESVLQKVAFALSTISLFLIATAALVLAGAIASGYSERLREAVLLRTLGASRRQMIAIYLAEYLCVGFCGAASGIILGFLASWGLSYYFFASLPLPPLGPVALVLLTVVATTVAAGIAGSLGIFKRPPLEALRAEF